MKVDAAIQDERAVNLISTQVATKTKQALDAGLSVMVCVGETLEEREAGRIDAVVLDDHMAALKGKFSDSEWARIAIAYEPVWAIGTGKTATPEQAQEVHASIRAWLATNVSPAIAKAPALSVSAGTFACLMKCT